MSGDRTQVWFLRIFMQGYLSGENSKILRRDPTISGWELKAGPLACPLAVYRYGYTTDYSVDPTHRFGTSYGTNGTPWLQLGAASDAYGGLERGLPPLRYASQVTAT